MKNEKRLKTIKGLRDHQSMITVKEMRKLLGPRYKDAPETAIERISILLNKISEHSVKSDSKFKSLHF